MMGRRFTEEQPANPMQNQVDGFGVVYWPQHVATSVTQWRHRARPPCGNSLHREPPMSNDGDYQHALLEIRKRLHDPRGSKAAVFVGAGFSRNAIPCTPARSTFPLWQQLTEGLVTMLYPNPADQSRVLERAGTTSAALRLAQEFQTAFGRPRLIDFVRDAIRDDEFQPSRLHSDLLELPWSDVFTTNYDRLLEKANHSLWKRHYDSVFSASDLPLARRPRIVKLHGSLPALEHLVLTEEDYRSYRRNYAPFVATVQAALTENVLCLIGFSGDDPNFLAWSGWLRDELRNAVPKTYLFTGNEMQPFQRQLLEERHIVPIPLKRIAGASSHEAAYRWLFEQLAQRPEPPAPPWNVVPQQTISADDPSVADEPLSPDSHDWIDTAILWRSHRQEYKGWHVLYRKATDRLALYTEFWCNHFRSVPWNDWPEAVSIFVLHELVWRWKTALRPLYDEVVFKVLDPQIKRFTDWRSGFTGATWEIRGKERQVALPAAELDDAYYALIQECFRHAREIGDDERFQRFLSELTMRHANVAPDVLNDRLSYIRYQEVLKSLGSLKYVSARHQLETWNTSGSAPIWAIRRAGLCLECDLVALGKSILTATLSYLRSVPVSATLNVGDLSSEGITLYLLAMVCASEESTHRAAGSPTASAAPQSAAMDSNTASSEYANGLLQEASQRQIRERLTRLADYGCNLSGHMEWLALASSPEPKATRGLHLHEGFDIGNIHRTMSDGTEEQLSAAYSAMRFIEDAGLPLKMTLPGSTMTIAGDLFHKAVRTIGHFAPHEAVGLVLRSRDTKLVEIVLTRQCLVRLSESQVNSLAGATMQAVREAVLNLAPPTKPGDAIDHFWEEQFKVATETVGRICVRLPEGKISDAFREMADLPQHPCIRDSLWRRDILAKCIRRLGSATDRKSAQRLLPALLALPVQGSAALPTKHDWHDPASIVADFDWNGDITSDTELSAQIDIIVGRIATARGDERSNLCHRAANLFCARLLSAEQSRTFTSSLFAHCDEHGVPAETGCFDSLVLLLPRHKDCDEREIFRRKYLSTGVADSQSWHILRHTHIPIQEFLSNKLRRIRWTQRDLSTILSLAEKWLESIGRREPASGQWNSKDVWLSMMCAKDSPAVKQAALCHCLATLENAILLNQQASARQRDQVEALIAHAHSNGWCVVQAAATRALLGKMQPGHALDEIRCRLTDRDVANVGQACDAIVRWCELGQARDFQVPQDLLNVLGTVVATRCHEALPLLISASINVIERLDGSRRTAYVQLLESGLKVLLAETEYAADQPEMPYSIGTKLHIRVAWRTAGRSGC